MSVVPPRVADAGAPDLITVVRENTDVLLAAIEAQRQDLRELLHRVVALLEGTPAVRDAAARRRQRRGKTG